MAKARRSKYQIEQQLIQKYKYWTSYQFDHHEHGSMWTTTRNDAKSTTEEPDYDFKKLRDLEKFLNRHNYPYREGAI